MCHIHYLFPFLNIFSSTQICWTGLHRHLPHVGTRWGHHAHRHHLGHIVQHCHHRFGQHLQVNTVSSGEVILLLVVLYSPLTHFLIVSKNWRSPECGSGHKVVAPASNDLFASISDAGHSASRSSPNVSQNPPEYLPNDNSKSNCRKALTIETNYNSMGSCKSFREWYLYWSSQQSKIARLVIHFILYRYIYVGFQKTGFMERLVAYGFHPKLQSFTWEIDRSPPCLASRQSVQRTNWLQAVGYQRTSFGVCMTNATVGCTFRKRCFGRYMARDVPPGYIPTPVMLRDEYSR